MLGRFKRPSWPPTKELDQIRRKDSKWMVISFVGMVIKQTNTTSSTFTKQIEKDPRKWSRWSTSFSFLSRVVKPWTEKRRNDLLLIIDDDRCRKKKNNTKLGITKRNIKSSTSCCRPTGWHCCSCQNGALFTCPDADFHLLLSLPPPSAKKKNSHLSSTPFQLLLFIHCYFGLLFFCVLFSNNEKELYHLGRQMTRWPLPKQEEIWHFRPSIRRGFWCCFVVVVGCKQLFLVRSWPRSPLLCNYKVGTRCQSVTTREGEMASTPIAVDYESMMDRFQASCDNVIHIADCCVNKRGVKRNRSRRWDNDKEKRGESSSSFLTVSSTAKVREEEEKKMRRKSLSAYQTPFDYAAVNASSSSQRITSTFFEFPNGSNLNRNCSISSDDVMSFLPTAFSSSWTIITSCNILSRQSDL